MPHAHANTTPLRKRLMTLGGATLAIAAVSAAPAFAQANGDTTHAAKAKSDSGAVLVSPTPSRSGSNGATGGGVIQLQLNGGGTAQLKAQGNGFVLQSRSAAPTKPKTKTAGDSTKADSAKAATDTAKAGAGKKP